MDKNILATAAARGLNYPYPLAGLNHFMCREPFQTPPFRFTIVWNCDSNAGRLYPRLLSLLRLGFQSGAVAMGEDKDEDARAYLRCESCDRRGFVML